MSGNTLPSAANDNADTSFAYQINNMITFHGNTETDTGYFEVDIDKVHGKIDIEFSFDRKSRMYFLRYGRTSISVDQIGLETSLQKLYNTEILPLSYFELQNLLSQTSHKVRELT